MLAKHAPAFRPDGETVTAGNSSPLNDGASLLLVARPRPGGNSPELFGITPIEAAWVLVRSGRSWGDVDLLELNEAFAA